MRATDPADGVRVIDQGLPDGPVRLSRRHRHAVLTMDVDGDAAAVTFVARAKRGRPELYVWMSTWTYERRDGEWRSLGGGGGNCGPDELRARPTRDELGAYIESSGGGWTNTRAGSLLPFPRRGISYANVRVSAEVDVLRVGSRQISTPDHGHQVIVWSSRRAPKVEALSGGVAVAVFDLADRVLRHRRRLLRPRFAFRRRSWFGTWDRA